MQFKKAEIIARQFLNKYNLTSPIDLEEACEILNIKIKYLTIESDSAMLYKGKYCDCLIVSSKQSLNQQRFNIAHEISHKLLNHNGTIFTSYSNNEQEKPLYEQEADICASELLIPTSVLKRVSAHYKYDLNKIVDFFKVSRQAMITKLKIKKLPCRDGDKIYGNFF